VNHSAEATSPGGQDERLRELQDRLSISLTAAGAVGSWEWDISERRLHLDARLAAFQGLDPGEAAAGVPVGQFFAAIHPDDAPRIRVAVAGMLRGAEVFFKSYRMLAPDGSIRWVEAHGRCLLDDNDEPERFSGILVDTTARQRVEERLRIAQTAGGVGTFEYVPGFSTATVSDQFCRLLGLDPAPVVAVSVINGLLVPGSAPLLKNRPERGLENGEYGIRRADTGELRWIARRGEVLTEAEGSAARQIGVIFDVTDLKRTQGELADLNRTLEQRVEQEIRSRQQVEERLRQSQKMEAIGQLTGGIAHDFNNLLTVIIGNVDMARRRLGAGADERVARALANALKSSERAASLTQRLLAFSRRQPLDPGRVDVARLVGGMFDLLNRSLGEQIEIRSEFEPNLWNVEADANQLESAILNLAVNARDAMNWQGVLTIAARNVTFEDAGEDDAVDKGDYVSLSVRDSGGGMPADVLARAFEPFFTTKEVGKGTGLGLSMVFGFVRQTGGDVRITSDPGHGTAVELLLPRCRSMPADGDEPQASGQERGSRRATILIVEDDPDVRTFAVEGLRDLGFNTLEAADGSEALAILDKGKAAIDLLLTDVVMPGMTGRELTEAARARDHGLRVLYMSGYPSDVIARNGRLEAGVVLLSKPFTMQALAARVHEVLEEHHLAAGS
jgi:signal transduction histidine kinase/CheY-like chemotaxis protein